MTGFESFEELYKHLEKSACDYKYAHQIGKLFEPFIEKYQENGDQEKENIAHNEREIFIFEVNEGQLNPRIIYTDPQGSPIPYPDITKFDDQSLNYIDSRLSSTKNPLLQARYAIALWGSKKKHAKYAQIAIDAYIELVDIFSGKDHERPDDFFGLRVVDSIKNAYILARKIREDKIIEHTKKIIVDLIKNYDWESKTSFALRKYLLELMIEEKFENEYFEPLNDIYSRLIENTSGHQKIMVLETVANINRKLGKDDKNELKKIAEEYEYLMNSSIEGNPLAALSFWESAIKYYKSISNDEKVDELNIKYEMLKKKAEYKEYNVKIDMTKIDATFEEVADKIIKMDKVDIIKLLIGDNSILPELEVVKKQAKEISKEHPITRFFPVTLLDEQGNVIQKFTTEEEKEHYGILNNYRLHMEMINNLLINKIFTKIFINNSLDVNDLLEYIEKNSWLGKELEKQSSKDLVVKYSWIDVIKPGIIQYFEETKKWIETGDEPSYVLPIDSLVLKVEGMYRDMCRLSGVPTFYSKRIGGEQIMHEKDLNLILRESPITVFNEDEIMLFKFVLIEKMGYNLRNKVAHALMTSYDYNFTYINLVILIILKFAKFVIN